MDPIEWLEPVAEILHIQPWPPDPGGLFWPVLMLLGGGLFGEVVARLTRLPRLLGYTFAGIAIALSGHGPATGQLPELLRMLVDVALALLLFDIGRRVQLRWLRVNRALLWTSLGEAALTVVTVYGAMAWFGLAPQLAMACAVLAVPASAAVAGRVAMEIGAEGQVSDRMVVLTALNTLYAALALTLLQGWLTLERLGDWLPAFARLGYNFLGSLLLAIVLARLVALIARRLDLRNDNAVLLLLGLVLMAITGARTLGLSTLLVPLMAGLVLRNRSERPWVWPRHFGTAGGVLVLMLFVTVGSAWSVETLAIGSGAALVLVIARAVAKLMAVNGLARVSGLSPRQGLALGVTLTPLSATALVMLADLHSVDPAFGAELAPIILSAIAMLELLGPLAVQWALCWARETPPSPDAERVARSPAAPALIGTPAEARP